MDLHHLEYIVEIAKEENISKESERLGHFTTYIEYLSD